MQNGSNGRDSADMSSSDSIDQPRKRGAASSILMAAMLGLVDALGWERPKNEIVQVADAPSTGDDLELDYRHLPPLDDRR
ncbi:MAG: hypothetical protein ACR2QO_14625 [Acidimicrobiales bacterium]